MANIFKTFPRMLGYTVGIPEKGSTYGNAKRNEQFWRCCETCIFSSSMFNYWKDFCWKPVGYFFAHTRSHLECSGDEETLLECPGTFLPPKEALVFFTFFSRWSKSAFVMSADAPLVAKAYFQGAFLTPWTTSSFDRKSEIILTSFPHSPQLIPHRWKLVSQAEKIPAAIAAQLLESPVVKSILFP